MNVLVAGAGYLGLPLAVFFRKEGHRVHGWTLSEKSASSVRQAGLQAVVGDLADPGRWAEQLPLWDAIVYCPSAAGAGPEGFRRLHGAGLGLALRFLKSGGMFFYASSTSVYGQDDGAWVEESSPACPLSSSAETLLRAEGQVLARGGHVLRLSGIYGPGRAARLRNFMGGRGLSPDGRKKWVNQIRREDAVAALEFLWRRKLPGGLWNVTDHEPVLEETLYRWFSEQSGRPLPEGEAERERKSPGNKRVSNRKLRTAGWSPAFPTFREGYRGLLAGNML